MFLPTQRSLHTCFCPHRDHSIHTYTCPYIGHSTHTFAHRKVTSHMPLLTERSLHTFLPTERSLHMVLPAEVTPYMFVPTEVTAHMSLYTCFCRQRQHVFTRRKVIPYMFFHADRSLHTYFCPQKGHSTHDLAHRKVTSLIVD